MVDARALSVFFDVNYTSSQWLDGIVDAPRYTRGTGVVWIAKYNETNGKEEVKDIPRHKTRDVHRMHFGF